MGLFKTKHVVIITIYISVWIIALPSTCGENENTNKTSLVYRNITSRDRSAAKFFSERLKGKLYFLLISIIATFLHPQSYYEIIIDKIVSGL